MTGSKQSICGVSIIFSLKLEIQNTWQSMNKIKCYTNGTGKEHWDFFPQKKKIEKKQLFSVCDVIRGIVPLQVSWVNSISYWMRMSEQRRKLWEHYWLSATLHFSWYMKARHTLLQIRDGVLVLCANDIRWTVVNFRIIFRSIVDKLLDKKKSLPSVIGIINVVRFLCKNTLDFGMVL